MTPTKSKGMICDGRPGSGIYCHTNSASRTPNPALFSGTSSNSKIPSSRSRTKTRLPPRA